MRIFINGIEDSAPYPGTTLGQILQVVESKKVLRGTFISRVRVNRAEIDLNAPASHNTPKEAIETLDIEISDMEELIDRNLKNTEDYLAKLLPAIRKAAALFQGGDTQEANKLFVSIVDGIDWFSQTMDAILEALGLNPHRLKIKNKTLGERKMILVDITSKMVDANKSKDWILLADLLEYEILPYYQDWLDILPEIKHSREN